MTDITPIKFYLAGSWERREELQGYMKQLEDLGHEVTSSWLRPNEFEDRDDDLTMDEQQRLALTNLEDIGAANAFIAFTEEPGSTRTRGGRHVEYGIVMGLSTAHLLNRPPKDVAIIGPRENMFYSAVHQRGQFDHFDDFLTYLEEEYGHPERETDVPGEQSSGS